MQVSRSWATASQLLGIEVITPYRLRVADDAADCVAFLRHFGGPQGMVLGLAIPPNWAPDPFLERCARKASLTCSHLNPEFYSVYDERRFKTDLMDWGYFGPPEKRPTWLGQCDTDEFLPLVQDMF